MKRTQTQNLDIHYKHEFSFHRANTVKSLRARNAKIKRKFKTWSRSKKKNDSEGVEPLGGKGGKRRYLLPNNERMQNLVFNLNASARRPYKGGQERSPPAYTIFGAKRVFSSRVEGLLFALKRKNFFIPPAALVRYIHTGKTRYMYRAIPPVERMIDKLTNAFVFWSRGSTYFPTKYIFSRIVRKNISIVIPCRCTQRPSLNSER